MSRTTVLSGEAGTGSWGGAGDDGTTGIGGVDATGGTGTGGGLTAAGVVTTVGGVCQVPQPDPKKMILASVITPMRFAKLFNVTPFVLVLITG